MPQKLQPIHEIAPASTPMPHSQPDLRTCPVCGQTYDMRKLDQADHHTDAPHEPWSGS